MFISRSLLSYLIAIIVIAGALTTGSAIAHIKNEASQFPDIEFSKSRFDIVVLVGAGIIPETPVFEPDVPFSRLDLAVWTALYNNLGAGGETPDTEALAKAALEQGLVGSLVGEATFKEINDLFFQGQLVLDQAEAVPTRAEAASYIASALTTEAGVSLLQKRGLETGPAGTISQVELRSGGNEHGDSSYFITIATQTLPMYAHGRVANGPIDLAQWQGRVVRRSYIRSEDGQSFWTYLEAEPTQAGGLDIGGQTETAEQDTQFAVQANHNLLYGLIAAVLVLGLFLFFRRKRTG